MTQGPIDALHWWRAPGALERFLSDLIELEARLLRPGGPWPPRADPARIAAIAPDESGMESIRSNDWGWLLCCRRPFTCTAAASETPC